MHTVSLFDAKTHLSSIVNDLLSGKEDSVLISRHGKPAVLVIPAIRSDTAQRIGIAQGRFTVPDDIDGSNVQIASLFGEEVSR
jgi:antitoxin (DNA-binding transcriptional repressor) of toxin-antitoxin stability system